MVNESELKSLWDGFSNDERNRVGDLVTFSMGIKLANRTYEQAKGDLSQWKFHLFEQAILSMKS